jgi:hypothetical protein
MADDTRSICRAPQHRDTGGRHRKIAVDQQSLSSPTSSLQSAGPAAWSAHAPAGCEEQQLEGAHIVLQGIRRLLWLTPVSSMTPDSQRDLAEAGGEFR